MSSILIIQKQVHWNTGNNAPELETGFYLYILLHTPFKWKSKYWDRAMSDPHTSGDLTETCALNYISLGFLFYITDTKVDKSQAANLSLPELWSKSHIL